MESAEAYPDRFRSMFLPLLTETAAFNLPHPLDEIIGIALLSTSGRVLFEQGQLLHCLSEVSADQQPPPLSAGERIVASIERTRVEDAGLPNLDKHLDTRESEMPALDVGGRKFIVFLQDPHVRLYACSRDRSWGIAARTLPVGTVVVAHARALVTPSFLPIFERFCDGFQ